MVDILLDYSGDPLPKEMETVMKQAAEQTLEDEKIFFDAEISVTLMNDEDIREINKQYRHIDKATDVLSFPLFSFTLPGNFDSAQLRLETGPVLLGDIVLSVDRVYSQAEEYDHSPLRELAYLIVHSTLHLLGYDHMREEDKSVMREKEEQTLSRIGQLR